MTFGAAKALMWGPVDAVVRCAVPLLLRSMWTAGAPPRNAHRGQARVRHIMGALESLPPVASREVANLARIHMSQLYDALHDVGWWDAASDDEGYSPFRFAMEAVNFAALGRSESARQSAQQAIRLTLEVVVPGFRLQRHGFRWRSLSFNDHVLLREGIMRSVCEEVAAEPRLLLPENALLLRQTAVSAVDRAIAWYRGGQ
jgi:hypothetical protein